MSAKRESERQIRESSIQLECRLYGQAPVQAEGTVMGKQLYFRARWEEWSFSVAGSEDVDPVDIQLPEQGFLREGQYGDLGSMNASWMNYDAVEEVIRQCAHEYFALQGTHPTKDASQVDSS